MNKELTALQTMINTLVQFFINYSFQVVGAVIVLIIGGMIANWVQKLIFRISKKKNLDITVTKFLGQGAKVFILGFAILVALGKFGITIAPFVAALSALAFGASFAIRGPLANYGAGLLIIMSRPFKVGNTITVTDVSGVVEDIKLAYTSLITEDGVEIRIPNNKIVGEIIHNSKENRIAEGEVGISYSDNPETAIGILQKTLAQFTEVSKNPPPQIGIQEFGDSAIVLAYRYWAPTQKYFQTVYAVNLAIFKALTQAKITLPFPQREIRMISEREKDNAAVLLKSPERS